MLEVTKNELNENDKAIAEWLQCDDIMCIDITKKKYINVINGKEETMEDVLKRVAGDNEEFMRIIISGAFCPAGRILANRGMHKHGRKISYSNCYVLAQPEDNLESIYETKKYMARTFSYGGGVGIDISKLAPRGAQINNSAHESTGAVSFCPEFSITTSTIGQNNRRGALMISIEDKHPDLIEFITHKTNLDNTNYANMSVKFSDEFFKVLEEDGEWTMEFYRPETGITTSKTMKASEIMDILAETAWDYAEPGILYWDKIQNYCLLGSDPDFKYTGTNPCVVGSTEVLTDKGYVRIDRLMNSDDKYHNIWNGYEWSKSLVEKTGENQPILYIRFSNDCTIRCTEYHKFVLKDGTRIEAKDLKEGDELISYKSFAYKGNLLEEDENRVLDLSKTIDMEGVKVVSIYSDGIADEVYCVREPKNHTVVFNGILTGNCGELPLPDFGSCMLGSMNLSYYFKKGFDINNPESWTEFDNDVSIAISYMNEVLEENIDLQPLPQQRESIINYRPIGLGIMGLADAFIQMGYTYGDEKSIELSHAIGYHMAFVALLRSAILASMYGSFKKCNNQCIVQSDYFRHNVIDNPYFTHEEKQYLIDMVLKYGLRNSQLLSIAPTGSISTIRNISGGIEPIFAHKYTRTTKSIHNTDYTYLVESKCAKEYHKDHPDEELPDYFVTARDIHYMDRIKVQAAWQEHVDNSISGTVNLPNDATVEDVKDLYITAHKLGLKGITVFREGCSRGAILEDVNSKKKDKDNESKEKTIDEKIKEILGSNPDPEHKTLESIAKYLEEKDPSLLNTKGEEVSDSRSVNNIPGSVTIMTRKDMGKRVEGSCHYMNTACGHMYVTVNHDSNLHLREVFVDTSKSGGCAANADCLGRYASACLRAGLSIEDVVDITKGVKCQACSKLKGRGVEIDGLSCGDIIARVIEEEEKRLSELRKIKENGNEQDIKEENILADRVVKKSDKINKNETKYNLKEISNNTGDKERAWNYKDHSYDENLKHNTCPDCGSPLTRGEGCPKCINCGFSKC